MDVRKIRRRRIVERLKRLIPGERFVKFIRVYLIHGRYR